jgi:hypothetical protein
MPATVASRSRGHDPRGERRIRRPTTHSHDRAIERDAPGAGPPGAQRRPRCAACGDVIGVYERIWVERADGTLEATSLLNLDDAQAAHGTALRLWHARCLREQGRP